MTDALSAQSTGQRLGMFPLSAVLYPHAQIPLHVFEPRYRALTRDCLAGDARFGVVLIERGAEVGGGDQRMAVGTRAVITQAAALSDGRWMLMVQGDVRIRVGEWLADDPYPLAMVEEWTPRVDDVAPSLLHRAEQCVRRTRGLLSESGATSALPAETRFDHDPDVASWQICGEAPLNMMDAQRVLSAPGTAERLELLIELTEAMELDLHRMLASG
jgi:Lon protease-like protein